MGVRESILFEKFPRNKTFHFDVCDGKALSIRSAKKDWFHSEFAKVCEHLASFRSSLNHIYLLLFHQKTLLSFVSVSVNTTVNFGHGKIDFVHVAAFLTGTASIHTS